MARLNAVAATAYDSLDTLRSSDCSTMPRVVAPTSTNTLLTGRAEATLAVCLAAGTFTKIRFLTGSTTPAATNARAGVWDSSGVKLGETADMQATVVAATTLYEIALASSVTLTRGQQVYLGAAFAGGTMPNLRGINAQASTVTALLPLLNRTQTGYVSGALPALSGGQIGAAHWFELVP